ncbi:hypothetical protein [Caulobacter endophyticus]|uniref:hypothetical protein n=1 Tax=Caulobacter endophyticus TaxID=2172652 RepID=UPI00240ED14B|nr:hypothetical protein [Caulobacter endophyticus]MDG2528919.1 hypothetical protein [Caulobacter endophyticus]
MKTGIAAAIAGLLAVGLVPALVGGPAHAGAGDAIGLTVSLDRHAPVYAFDDRLSLTIEAQRDAVVTIWLLDPSDQLSRLTAEDQKLVVKGGVPLRYPSAKGFRVEPPAGRYELRVTAEADTGGGRGLGDATARLPGRDVREQKTLRFQVESPVR